MPFERCLPILLAVALVPSYVSAQVRQVGGHIGVATSFVTVSGRTDPATGQSTQTISDRVALVVPIGISIHTSDTIVVDFETQVALQLHPPGTAVFNVDPGVIYNFGLAAVGLRLLLPVGATPSAAGLIPLIHKGFVDLGFSTWFLEAAFPIVYHGTGLGTGAFVTFDAVLHTGFEF
jgi:hypothetical protein